MSENNIDDVFTSCEKASKILLLNNAINAYRNLQAIDGYDLKADAVIENIKLYLSSDNINTKISSRGYTLLMIAVMLGHEFFVKELLDLGADPQITDFYGNNAFALGMRCTTSLTFGNGFRWQINALQTLLNFDPLLVFSTYTDSKGTLRNMREYLKYIRTQTKSIYKRHNEFQDLLDMFEKDAIKLKTKSDFDIMYL